MKYAEKIISLVGLQYDPEMEILEFHEMREATEMRKSVKEPGPVESNSFEFFIL